LINDNELIPVKSDFCKCFFRYACLFGLPWGTPEFQSTQQTTQHPWQYCGLVQTGTTQTRGLQKTTTSKERERKVEKTPDTDKRRAEQYQKAKQFF